MTSLFAIQAVEPLDLLFGRLHLQTDLNDSHPILDGGSFPLEVIDTENRVRWPFH